MAFYRYSFELPNGQNIAVLDQQLGKYGAIVYGSRSGIGNVYATKKEAESYLALIDGSFMGEEVTKLVLKPTKVEKIAEDGTAEEVSQKGLLALLKKMFGRGKK